MRAYHFLSAENALDDLARRRVKISEIDKLNDPFELWCSAQEDRAIRRALLRYKKEMAKRCGMICFCKHWHSPVLWSHYSEKHRGICLGFEVDEQFLRPVIYVKKRQPLQFPLTPEAAERLLYTKYHDWCYEEELRGWVRLEERDASTGYYFYDLDEKIQLREVIAGPLCAVPKPAIDAAVKRYDGDIRIIKSRLAFTTFQVVQQKRGFRA